jgi:hypothetical protein
MSPRKRLDELEAAARKLGFAVRVEKGRFRGGRCTVGGERVIMLNKRHDAEARFVILAESLRGTPLDTVYLTPAVREALRDAWATLDARAQRAEASQAPSGAGAASEVPADTTPAHADR